MPSEKRQRQRENRARRRAEEARRARLRIWKRRGFWLLALAAIMVAATAIAWATGRLDTSRDTATEATTTTVAAGPPVDYAGYRAQPTACGAEAPPPVQAMSFPEPEDQQIPADAAVTASLVTSCGDIVLDLDPAAAPETVNSFVFLARQGYFDGTVFHRIMGGFMIQGGDPSATGTGDPGYAVPDEFPADGFVYERGVAAMANAGPGTSGSQFFIVTGDASGLQPQFSVLGRAIDSDDTLNRIAAVPVALRGAEESAPLESVYIERVEIDVTS